MGEEWDLQDLLDLVVQQGSMWCVPSLCPFPSSAKEQKAQERSQSSCQLWRSLLTVWDTPKPSAQAPAQSGMEEQESLTSVTSVLIAEGDARD